MSFQDAVDYCENQDAKMKTEWSSDEVKLARQLLEINPSCERLINP